MGRITLKSASLMPEVEAGVGYEKLPSLVSIPTPKPAFRYLSISRDSRRGRLAKAETHSPSFSTTPSSFA